MYNDQFEIQRLSNRIIRLEERVAMLEHLCKPEDESEVVAAESEVVAAEPVVVAAEAASAPAPSAASVMPQAVPPPIPVGAVSQMVMPSEEAEESVHEGMNPEQREEVLHEPAAEPLYTQEDARVKARSANEAAAMPRAEKQHGMTERRFGKTVMSILASLLVFVGLVYLGKTVHGHLSDSVKVGIIYAVSALVAVFGLVKMHKEGKYKVLYTSLAACGLGSIYISTLVAHFAFGFFSSVVLLSIIGVWIALLVVLSRRRNMVFSIICNLGIVVSTGLSVLNWASSPVGLFIYIVTMVALYMVTKTRDLKRDEWLLVQIPVVCLLMLYKYYDSALSLVGIIGVITLVLVWQLFYYRIEKSNSMLYALNNALTFTVSFVMTFTIVWNWYFGVDGNDVKTPFVVFAVVVIALCVYYYYRFRADGEKIIFNSMYALAAMVLPHLYYVSYYYDYARYFLVAAILLVLGVVTMKYRFRVAGYLYLLLGLVFKPGGLTDGMSLSIYFAIVLVMAICLIWRYNKYEKHVLTMLSMIGVGMLWFEDILDAHLSYFLCGMISLMTNTKFYHMDIRTKEREEESCVVGYIFNVVMMCLGLLLILIAGDDTSLRIVNIIEGTASVGLFVMMATVVGLAFVNNRSLYRYEEKSPLASVYICAKFTIIVFVILTKLDTLSFVMSIVGIVLAIIFVVVGFRTKIKAFRLYGLGLSMIGVVKLALFDIEYSNSVMRPIGFFIAGGLCYLISWLYSRLEKQIQDE